jgi:hypothetical protein
MFPTFDVAACRRASTGARRGILVAVWLLLLCFAPQALAQNTFSSGSTGADGSFEPTSNQTIVVPDSGVLNYTTINIPSTVTVTFVRNAKNKPVVILASGNVVIAGILTVDGKTANSTGGFGTGGPGGFDGAAGGFPFDASLTGATGDGPGGGGGGFGSPSLTSPGGGAGASYAGSGTNGGNLSTVTPSAPGPRYGSVTLIPLVGGSGGGGGGATTARAGGAGGGGGGAILIASSGNISFTGVINARGGNGGTGAGGGGGGAGGAIRFVANTITGGGTLRTSGGSAGISVTNTSSTNGGRGGDGFIRIEANDYSSFTPSTDPLAISYASPHPVNTTTAPALRIASVAGISAPASPLGSLHGVPDVVVPTTQANPVTVAIEASNVPVGTVATVTLTPQQGARTSTQSSALAGTDSASTASASVNLPAGMSVITATAVIDLTSQSAAARPPLFIEGERVTRIEVAATYGGASEVTYVTDSGRRIKRASE